MNLQSFLLLIIFFSLLLVTFTKLFVCTLSIFKCFLPDLSAIFWKYLPAEYIVSEYTVGSQRIFFVLYNVWIRTIHEIPQYLILFINNHFLKKFIWFCKAENGEGAMPIQILFTLSPTLYSKFQIPVIISSCSAISRSSRPLNFLTNERFLPGYRSKIFYFTR